jgi:hypothetical protein
MSVQSQGLIGACSPWLVRRVLGLCVAAKNKTVRGTWVEALDLSGLEGPKRTISCEWGGVLYLVSESRTARLKVGGLWDPTSKASVQSQGFISACSPWLVRRVLGPCVAAKNKTVRGTWVEALDLGGLGGPKRTISY